MVLKKKSKTRIVAVSSSPFNEVKLELALIIVFAIAWMAVLNLWLETTLWKVVWGLAYGIVGCIWLIWRVNTIMHSCKLNGEEKT